MTRSGRNSGDTRGVPTTAITPRDQMNAYDQLPTELRDALKDLPIVVSADTVLYNHRIGDPVSRQVVRLAAFANAASYTIWRNHLGSDAADDLWHRNRLTTPERLFR